MIKEIMLASALFSNNSQVYNINNSFTQYTASVSADDLNNSVSTLIIDLNSGDSFLCNLNSFEDGVFTILEGSYVQQLDSQLGTLNLSYFINYLYSCLGFNSETIWTDSYMELTFDFDLDGVDFNDKLNNNCYYTATLGSVAPHGPNSFYQLCSWYEGSNLDQDYAHYTHTVEFDSFISESFTSDLYFILTLHNITIPNYDNINLTLNFGYDYVSLELRDILGMWHNTSSLVNRYTNFIYDNYFKLQQAYDDLDAEYVQLEGDYSELGQINNDLITENERLNSKHALSNIFDIIRSSFNGIVDFLEIELMPNLTIGTIIFIPVVIGVIFFILKALVL